MSPRSSRSCFCRWSSSRYSRSTTRPIPRRRGTASRSIGSWAMPAIGPRRAVRRRASCSGSIWTSCVVAAWVTVLSVLIGTSNAFLIERGRFFGKQALSMLMLAPLVIPGVILGISILAFASRVAQFVGRRFRARLGLPAPGAAAGGVRSILLHRDHRDAHHQRAPAPLRPHARGGRIEPRRQQAGGVAHHRAALSASRPASAPRRSRSSCRSPISTPRSCWWARMRR